MKILLAIDDSQFAGAAVRMVISQNQPRRTSIRVLHVVEPIKTAYYPELTPPYPTAISDIERARMKSGRQLTAQVVEKLRAKSFKVGGSVLRGHARTTIVEAAGKWHADLIVVGSHGRTGIAKLLLGSVSEYVVRHASCSVEIVRSEEARIARKGGRA